MKERRKEGQVEKEERQNVRGRENGDGKMSVSNIQILILYLTVNIPINLYIR